MLGSVYNMCHLNTIQLVAFRSTIGMLSSFCLLFAETNDDTGVPDTLSMSEGGEGQSPPNGAGQYFLYTVLYSDDIHGDIFSLV